MSEIKKLKILTDILGSSYRSGGEILFACPKCEHHKKKLSINIDKDKFKCWVCDYHGRSIRRMVRYYGDHTQLADWLELMDQVDINSFSENLFSEEPPEEEETVALPEGFVSLTDKSVLDSSSLIRNFLKRRGITELDIVRWKIGVCSEGEFSNRIIVPSFGLKGYCNFFVARTYMNSYKKYMNPPSSKNIIFNELFIDWDSDLTIVEGVFDAIVSGPNSIPILGSTLRENAKLFQEIAKNDTAVYIALDPDAEKKALHLINNLLSYGVQVYKVDIAPFSDVGEMSKEEYKKRKDNAVLMDSDNYLLYNLNTIGV
jgi:DNA primase